MNRVSSGIQFRYAFGSCIHMQDLHVLLGSKRITNVPMVVSCWFESRKSCSLAYKVNPIFTALKWSIGLGSVPSHQLSIIFSSPYWLLHLRNVLNKGDTCSPMNERMNEFYFMHQQWSVWQGSVPVWPWWSSQPVAPLDHEKNMMRLLFCGNENPSGLQRLKSESTRLFQRLLI